MYISSIRSMELAKFRTLKYVQSKALVKIWTLKSIRKKPFIKIWTMKPEVGKFGKPGVWSLHPMLSTTILKVSSLDSISSRTSVKN